MMPQIFDEQHQLVLRFMEQANQETPQSPTVPSLEVRKLRAKLILEEAMETVFALGFEIYHTGKFNALVCMDNLGLHDIVGFSMAGVADGCADLKVVTVGTEIACGINGKPIFEEVMRSNFTKFIDGHMRDDGKWQKGPSYEPPNLEPILKAQGMK